MVLGVDQKGLRDDRKDHFSGKKKKKKTRVLHSVCSLFPPSPSLPPHFPVYLIFTPHVKNEQNLNNFIKNPSSKYINCRLSQVVCDFCVTFYYAFSHVNLRLFLVQYILYLYSEI